MDIDFIAILCIIIPMIAAGIFLSYSNKYKATADYSDEISELNQLISNGRKNEAIKKLMKDKGISKKAATDLVLSLERKLLSR